MDAKLKKALSLRTDGGDIKDCLTSLSTFYGKEGNTREARWALREDIEAQGLAMAQEFVGDFAALEQTFESLYRSVDNLTKSCDTAVARLEATERETAEFLQVARKMQQDKASLQHRGQQIEHFLRSYQLSDDEAAALETEDLNGPAGVAFFAAFARLRVLRTQCQSLIHESKLAARVEMLESLALREDVAYERLYKWVKDRCPLVDSDNADASQTIVLRKALRALQGRPAYFSHCKEIVGSSRHHAVRQRFIAALTKGGARGTPRPIEMHAHDPIRYASDMLAWVHQAIAGERELISGYFDQVATEGDATTGGNPDGEQDSTVTTTEVLNRILDGIAQILKTRLHQVIDGNSSLLTALKLIDLLCFYNRTITVMIGPSGGLAKVTAAAETIVRGQYKELLNRQAERLVHSPPPYAADLSVSAVVTETMGRLDELLAVFPGALMPAEEQTSLLQTTLLAFVDPLLRMCRLSAEGLDTTDTCVYLINNITGMQAVLLPYTFAASWVHRLSDEMERWEEALVSDQARDILMSCGITSKLGAIATHDGVTALATLPGMTTADMTECLKAFYSTLFTLDLQSLERLCTPRLRTRARADVCRLLATAYETMYNAVSAPENGYGDTSAMLLHSPDQVRNLLDVEDGA